MRRLAMCLAIAFLAFGCDDVDEPEPWVGAPDELEVDDSWLASKEQQVHAGPATHTIVPADDEDWIRFRITEVDVSAGDDLYPWYWLANTPAVGGIATQIRDESGAVPSSTYEGGLFTEPGVYFAKVVSAGGDEGKYYSWLGLFKLGEADPDLVATTVTIDPVLSPGAATLLVRIANQGGADVAVNFSIRACLSDDRILDGLDTDLGDVPVTSGIPAYIHPEIPAYYSYPDVQLDLTMPSTPGAYYVLVKVDDLSDIGESDETNNVGVGSTLITVADGDLEDAREPDDTTTDADGQLGVTDTDTLVTFPDCTFHPVTDGTDVDLFRITPDTTKRYEIWTDRLRGGADTEIELLDSAGDPLPTPVAVEDGGLENGATYLTHEFTLSGDYYIRVTDENGSTGAYDLHVRAVDATAATSDAYEPDDVDETKFGGELWPWRMLRPGDQLSRSFSGDGAEDVDWMVYPVGRDDDLKTHTIKTTNVAADCDTVLELYKTSPWTWIETDDDLIETTSFIQRPLEAGLYYVKITNKGTAGDYEIWAETPSTPP